MIGSAKAINAFMIGPSVRTTCLFFPMFFPRILLQSIFYHRHDSIIIPCRKSDIRLLKTSNIIDRFLPFTKHKPVIIEL